MWKKEIIVPLINIFWTELLMVLAMMHTCFENDWKYIANTKVFFFLKKSFFFFCYRVQSIWSTYGEALNLLSFYYICLMLLKLTGQNRPWTAKAHRTDAINLLSVSVWVIAGKWSAFLRNRARLVIYTWACFVWPEALREWGSHL